MSLTNIKVYLFLMIILMVLHQGLFTYLFQGTPLIAWKQVIGMALIIFLILGVLADIIRLKMSVSSFYISLLAVIFLYYYFYLFVNTDYIVGYLLKLFGCAYYLYALIVFSRFNESQLKISARGMFLMGVVISFGVVLDSQTQLFQFANATQNNLEIELNEYRSSYLLGSSTLLFSVLSIPIVLYDVFLKKYKRKVITNSQYYLYFCLSLIAIFLSGSRSSFIYMLIFIIAVLSLRFNVRRYIFTMMIVFLIAVTVIILGQNTPMMMRLSSSLSFNDPGNIGRIAYWYWFFGDGLSRIGGEYFLGEGLGYLESARNVFATKHFESSFISLYVETGIVGVTFFYIIFFMIPVFMARNILTKGWLLLMTLSTISSPSLFAYVYMISLGAAVGSSIVLRNNKRTVFYNQKISPQT